MRKALYILGELNDLDVEWLVTNGRRERRPAGAVLIQEGKPVDTLFILLDGRLSVSMRQGERQQILGYRGVGEILGEMSFVDARPPSATVAAESEVVVLALPHRLLAARLQQDTGFAARFYRAVAVFLAYRLRDEMARSATGRVSEGSGAFDASLGEEDELDLDVMSKVYQGGQRFDRILKRLAGEYVR